MRLHTLVAVRIAQILDLLLIISIPFIFEIAAIRDNLVSVAHLDEHRALMAHHEACHTRAVQCPFDAVPYTLKMCRTSSWIHYRADLFGRAENSPFA